MARAWDERFEGAGYEETWSEGETVAAGCTLDQDYATSNLATPPDDWQSQCLQCVIDTVGDETYVEHIFASDMGLSYVRAEWVFTALPTLTNQQSAILLKVYNRAVTTCFMIGLKNDGAATKIWFVDAQNGTDDYGPTAVQGTFYRVEVKWDNPNNAWEWKVDGVSQGTGSFAQDIGLGRIRLGWIGSHGVGTVCHDNFAIDDADWVGAEAAVGGGTITFTEKKSTTLVFS
jgi:hypothetical protein